MSQTIITLIDILKNQGFSFLLMGAMLYYLNDQNHELKAETREEIRELKIQVEACNKSNQDLLLNQIKRNSDLLQMYEENHRHELRPRRLPPVNFDGHE